MDCGRGHGLRAGAMSISRRGILGWSIGAAGLIAAGRRSGRADTYPSRPVLLSVGFAAGGGTDLVARMIADWLARHLGQPFVVENRTGMGGNLAIEKVLKSPPDGYNLLLAAPNCTIGASLYKKLPFDFRRDAQPVAFLIQFPNLMVVSPVLPVRSVQEFIDFARASPRRLTFAC